jgi:hypothetical protein
MLQSDMTNNRQTNSDLETKLASLSSIESVQQRAEDLGFQPADPVDITYVVVPGYTPHTAVNMSSPEINQPQALFLLPDYSESLLDWLTRKLASSAPAGGQR